MQKNSLIENWNGKVFWFKHPHDLRVYPKLDKLFGLHTLLSSVSRLGEQKLIYQQRNKCKKEIHKKEKLFFPPVWWTRWACLVWNKRNLQQKRLYHTHPISFPHNSFYNKNFSKKKKKIVHELCPSLCRTAFHGAYRNMFVKRENPSNHKTASIIYRRSYCTVLFFFPTLFVSLYPYIHKSLKTAAGVYNINCSVCVCVCV